MDPDKPNDLASAFEEELRRGGLGGSVTAWSRLTTGASRETFKAEVVDLGVGQTNRPSSVQSLIVQRERPGSQKQPDGMAAEAAVVAAAGKAGVPVAEVVLTNGERQRTAFGPSFFATRAVAGETLARRILRDEQYSDARSKLISQLGGALAMLHQADPAVVRNANSTDELAAYRDIADDMGMVSPAFEFAFRWLQSNRPERDETALVHGDFRLGNLIVDSQGLVAVIDWELAHVGDPMEDLAWLCVKAWRFGGEAPVAGIGEYHELFDAYEQAGGGPVDSDAVLWWQVLGSLKWGIMCGIQLAAHRSGAYRSLELAAIGCRIPEQEHDVLSLIGEVESGRRDV